MKPKLRIRACSACVVQIRPPSEPLHPLVPFTLNPEIVVNVVINVPVDSADNAPPDVLTLADAAYTNVVSLGLVLAKETLNSMEFVVPLTTVKGNALSADTRNCPEEAPIISILVILNEDTPDVGVKANAEEHR